MMHLATKIPNKYNPNLSAKESEEKRKDKGKGEGKNYYNTKEFKIASKGAYKDWPHPWSPSYRRGDLHTPSNLPTYNLKVEIKLLNLARLLVKSFPKR